MAFGVQVEEGEVDVAVGVGGAFGLRSGAGSAGGGGFDDVLDCKGKRCQRCKAPLGAEWREEKSAYQLSERHEVGCLRMFAVASQVGFQGCWGRYETVSNELREQVVDEATYDPAATVKSLSHVLMIKHCPFGWHSTWSRPSRIVSPVGRERAD